MTVEHHAVWQDDAACAGLDPAMFFPERGASVKEAIAVCDTCPVKADCLNHAITHRETIGIYGGTTGRERKRLSRGTPQRRRGITHGTPSGYAQHLNRGEKPCWWCADANSRYQETTGQLRKEGRP